MSIWTLTEAQIHTRTHSDDILYIHTNRHVHRRTPILHKDPQMPHRPRPPTGPREQDLGGEGEGEEGFNHNNNLET